MQSGASNDNFIASARDCHIKANCCVKVYISYEMKRFASTARRSRLAYKVSGWMGQLI